MKHLKRESQVRYYVIVTSSVGENRAWSWGLFLAMHDGGMISCEFTQAKLSIKW